MFGLFHKNNKDSTKILLKLSGLHCTSCSLNIDGELEDLEGVHEASTSYAKSETIVHFDAEKLSAKKVQEVIEKLGYQVTEIVAKTS